MLTKGLCRLFTATTRACPNAKWAVARRFTSTHSVIQTSTANTFDKAILHYTPLKQSTASVLEHVSRLRPFSVPTVPQPAISTPSSIVKEVEGLELTSVLRKRRLKMNKHKHKKLRKRTRALRKKLGK